MVELLSRKFHMIVVFVSGPSTHVTVWLIDYGINNRRTSRSLEQRSARPADGKTIQQITNTIVNFLHHPHLRTMCEYVGARRLRISNLNYCCSGIDLFLKINCL